MEIANFSKFGEYGLIGLILGFFAFVIWRMLIWVMKWVDKQSEQHTIERSAWVKTLEAINNSIQLHNQSSMEARKSAEEAHRYQREEHEKLGQQLDKTCGCLDNIKDGLGRINGYKS